MEIQLINDSWVVDLRKNRDKLKEEMVKNMFCKKNKIKELERKIFELGNSIQVLKADQKCIERKHESSHVILMEVLEEMGFKFNYKCYSNNSAEIRKTHELLLETENYQLWTKRKK